MQKTNLADLLTLMLIWSQNWVELEIFQVFDAMMDQKETRILTELSYLLLVVAIGYLSEKKELRIQKDLQS